MRFDYFSYWWFGMIKGLFASVTGRSLRIFALAALLGGVPISANADLVLETPGNLSLYGIEGLDAPLQFVTNVDGNQHVQDAIDANNALTFVSGGSVFPNRVNFVGKTDNLAEQVLTDSMFSFESDIGTITLTCVNPVGEDECISLDWDFDVNPNLEQDWRIVKIGIKASTDLAYFLVEDEGSREESVANGGVRGTITGIGAISGSIDIASVGLPTDLFQSNNENAQAFSHIEFFGTTIPEPGTLALFAVGLAGLGAIRRRKKAAR